MNNTPFNKSLFSGGFFDLFLIAQNTLPIRHTFTLNKTLRLKGKKKIQSLFDQGKVISYFPLRIVYHFVEDGSPLQAGFSVSKRKFRKATDRNRIRRLMREAWRLNSVGLKDEMSIQGWRLAVFIIYVGNELPSFHEIEKTMKGVIDKLTKINKADT